MTALVDTHTLLWSVIQPEKLSASATEILADPTNEIFVSAASAWEIATKVRLGKLSRADTFERNFISVVDTLSYKLLPITVDNAMRAGRLLGEHGDPFDRMIAAQALELDIPVISADRQLDPFGIRRIW